MRIKQGKTAGSPAVLLILGVFTVLCMLLVVMGAKSYQKLTVQLNANDEVRASLNYVANKVRFAGDGSVGLTEVDGVQVLELSDDGFYNYIYFYDGHIMEAAVEDSSEFTPKTGDAILKLKDFSMKINEKGQLVLTAQPETGEPAELRLAPKNGTGWKQ